MKRKKSSKSLQKRRRLTRLRKLKIAALTLGLATAWGGSAEAGTTFNATATATITLANSAYTVSDLGASSTSTVTLTVTGISDVPEGQSASGSSSIIQNIGVGQGNGYYYVGTTGTDLVLSFPNGGDGVIGQFWGALFIDGEGNGITEGQILQQLESTPLRNGVPLDPNSPLGILDRDYGNLLRTSFGEEATLVAFTNNAAGPNHGIAAGVTTVDAVPEPASFAIIATAAGMILLSGRRSD